MTRFGRAGGKKGPIPTVVVGYDTRFLSAEFAQEAGGVMASDGETFREDINVVLVAPKGMGPLAIGLALTLIHLISIPVTNTSVNPARSTSQALFVGDWALGQLWLFWVAPIVGAWLAGTVYKRFFS